MKIAILECYPNEKITKNPIDAHLRNSIILKNYLNADLLITTKHYLNALKNEYDILILGYATRYAPFVLIKKLIEKNPNAIKIVISNEYNIAISIGGFKPFYAITNYEQLNSKGSVLGHICVNLNLLLSDEPNASLSKKYDCIYYGTFRINRSKYFKEYLQNEIYLSTSPKNFKKYKFIGCNPTYIEKLSWDTNKQTLNLFKYSLYIEDINTHSNFNNLANRWYEAGICNNVMFFDINCINTIKKSEINKYFNEIEFYFVKNHNELLQKIEECNKNFEYHLNMQKSWREQESALKINLLENIEKYLNKLLTL